MLGIMYSVIKRIHFSYGHRLKNHPSKCSRLHGHNGLAEVVCETAKLGEDSMVVDFDHISEVLETWIDDNLDHRTLLNRNDKLASQLEACGEEFLAVDQDPTAETIAEMIYNKAKEFKLPVKEVRVWETPNSCATFAP